MATEVKAICKCGIEELITVGDFMFKTGIEYFPAACKECKNVIQVNLKGELKCSFALHLPVSPWL